LVTISPHCYDVFLNHYPRVSKTFEPLHYTEYLASVMDREELQFQKSIDRKVTYHDPCFLGRRNGHYEAPRMILENIQGLTLVEMENSGPDGLCCGGGGGRMWMETAPDERFSDLRVQEAASTGASVIATACPYCITCLEDSLKSLNIDGLEVLDIAEIAAQALS
jgi:Fe-S oxidoreductase